MKVIIAGSRSINDQTVIQCAIAESGFEITQLVSGMAKDGVDALGVQWATTNDIPIEPFPALWDDLTYPDAIIKTAKWGQKYDARAGLRRNQLMAVYADALIAIWDGKSHGTKHMIKMAKKRELPIYIYRTDTPRLSGHFRYETREQFYRRLAQQANQNLT